MIGILPKNGCESWTIKKAEHWRIDAFKVWCWRRLLRVPWTARRSNQSILKEISPEYSLEGLILKLKLQYFGHLMQRTDSLEKTLMLGKIEGGRRRGWHNRFDGHELEQALGVGDGWGRLACCSPWSRKESDMTERLNWLTETKSVWGPWPWEGWGSVHKAGEAAEKQVQAWGDQVVSWSSPDHVSLPHYTGAV